MKWHKFEATFWDSETADILEQRHGLKGVVAYLRMISAITLEIQNFSEVQLAHEKGWTKSKKDWARIARVRPDLCMKIVRTLDEVHKIKIFVSHTNRLTIQFKNFAEFVHKDALSSKSRDSKGRYLAGHVAGQLADQDKRREEKRKTEATHTTVDVKMKAFPRTQNRREKEERAEQQKAIAREFLNASAEQMGSPTGPLPARTTWKV